MTTTRPRTSTGTCITTNDIDISSKQIYIVTRWFSNRFVKVEANGKITIVNSNGDQFIVPTCRIISDNKYLVDDFVVDIEYREILQYKIIDHQTVRDGITY